MARFDRVIRPGGTGKITVTIDTTKIRDGFQEKVTVWSNDSERRSIVLYLTGKVRPHVALMPGGYLSLCGVVGSVPKEYLDIINNHKSPMKITGIDSDLKNRIRWSLEEINPGYAYRLEVEDISRTYGDYTGHLYVQTDNHMKSEMVVIVNGYISKKSSKNQAN